MDYIDAHSVHKAYTVLMQNMKLVGSFTTVGASESVRQRLHSDTDT
jgi:hypothetical protein